MTRYFYPASRAHHALCMALDFSMQFQKRFGIWDTEGLMHLRGASLYKIYLTPESQHQLYLLAPEMVAALTTAGLWPEREETPDEQAN